MPAGTASAYVPLLLFIFILLLRTEAQSSHVWDRRRFPVPSEAAQMKHESASWGPHPALRATFPVRGEGFAGRRGQPDARETRDVPSFARPLRRGREPLCSARTVRRDSMHTPLASSAYSHFPLYSPIFPRKDLVRSNPWFSTFSLLVNPTDSVLSEAAFSRRKNSSKDR